jgi:uncharacterized membrane protein YhaH (DUF805 family)
MSCTFDSVKYFLENLCLTVSLISFVIFFSITNEKDEKYKEYTSLYKIPLNLFIFLLLILLLFNSIFPKTKLKIITKYFKIIESPKVKTLILILLALIFIAANNIPQLLQGIFFFLCGLSMFIIQTIFDCSILNKKNKKDKLNISQNNSSTAEIKKAQNISVDVENEEKKDTKKNNINNSNNNNPYNVPDDF